MRVVVVGASLGGVRTVQGLRRRGCTDEIVLVGAEPGSADGVASDRPPLSKAYLSGTAESAPPLVSPEDLAGLDVALVQGRATDLDLPGRRVVLHGGTRSGSTGWSSPPGPRPRWVPELEPRPGVHTLRTAADGAAIRAASADGARVVVVGGGFIGAEVAGTLTALGRKVSVVEPLPALMIRGLGPEVGACSPGGTSPPGSTCAWAPGSPRSRAATGSRASSSPTARGCPPTSSSSGSAPCPRPPGWPTRGWTCATGSSATSTWPPPAPRASSPSATSRAGAHPRYGEDVRVEHWTNAVETAAVVAANLTGEPTVHDALPYVWTDQLGARLQVFGQVRPQDELQVVFGDLDGSFVAISGGDGLLRAVMGFGAIKQLMPYRKLLVAGAAWDEALAL